MSKIEKAKSLLDGMGATAEEVAAFLRNAGMVGTPDTSDDDPVCRYLKRELNTADVNIEFGEVYVDSNGSWSPNAGLPDAVDDFLSGFDVGNYPDLVAK